MKECYRAEVLASYQLTPSMMRVEIGGENMKRFRSSGFPDEWVRLVFPSENGRVTMPCLMDGRWQMPTDLPRSSLRPYTVRRWDRRSASIVVDFVLHEGGTASDWSRNACRGDEIGVTSPQGKYVAPDDAKWILLVADATGLPAVARILEEKRCDRPFVAHIEIPIMQDALPELDKRCDVTWHTGFGSTPGYTRLLRIAESLQLPSGPGYIWVAGEAKVTTGIRRHLCDERGVPKDSITAIGYWIAGKARD